MKITVTHEINKKAWSEEWGVPLNEVREDAKNYILHGVASHLDELGLSSEGMPEPLAACGRRLWK
ncbi:MAG: hypothetical protein QGH15_24100 [Kiritimatiellia bacterium]|jgi:hypothetical protein|nr:hypothetical protein [Kiritimatiellia bacterium]